MNDEFDIGWEDKAPATIGSRVRRAVALLLLTTFVLGAGLALMQRTIGVSVFEWGKVKKFSGILKGQPYPHLLVPRPRAIRCISGGIPPILLVRQTNGVTLHFLLVSRDGHPVNKEVLDMVAEPVQITGEVVRQGELLILRADPATYRRVST